MVTKELNIKNRTYYFWNDMINIKDFDSKLLKLDKKLSMDINIYYIGYVTKKPEYNINSVNPLYLLIGEIDGFIEEKEDIRYLNIALKDNNNEVLKNMQKYVGIKNQIEKINNGLVGEYEKDYMKTKFDSDDNLLLNAVPKSRILTIVIRSVFKKDGKYYPQFFLDDSLYEI